MGNKTMDKKDEFATAAEAEGLEGRTLHPFIELTGKVGNWITAEVMPGRDTKFTPKKGKNKGKVQDTTYFDARIIKTNMENLSEGDMVTISPSGLLKYQLSKGLPSGVTLPAVIAIKYLGRDDEDRHQTEVRYPSSR